MRRIAFSLAALLVHWALGASAEIYHWTDESGTVHFTEDIAEVPPEQREATRAPMSAPGADRIQSYAPPANAILSTLESARAPGAASRAAEPPVYRIRVQPGAGPMRVEVRLNDRVDAPFLIDTGASDVVITDAVARQLSIDVGPDTLRAYYTTANGVVESPVVLLESVELGGARATNVRASISSSMPIGMLGLSFFNRFSYRIDASAGLVTLMPNDASDGEAIRGGRSEQQWRSEFRSLRARLELVDEYVEDLDPLRQRHDRRGGRARERFQRELEFLEQQADRDQVPDAWRY